MLTKKADNMVVHSEELIATIDLAVPADKVDTPQAQHNKTAALPNSRWGQTAAQEQVA